MGTRDINSKDKVIESLTARLEAADRRIAELEQSKHELERLQAAIKVKGGDEHYPTEFAYLAVCKANEDKRARIAELEAAQRWISVKERLPAVSEYRNGDKFKSMDSNELVPFLVCCEDTEIPFRAFYDGKNWGDGWGKPEVTHWQPLPQPPEKGE